MKNIGALSRPYLAPRNPRRFIEKRENVRYIMPQFTSSYTFTGVAGDIFYYKSTPATDPDSLFKSALAQNGNISSMLVYDNKILVFPQQFYFDISHPENGIVPIEYPSVDTTTVRFSTTETYNSIEATSDGNNISWNTLFKVGDSITITSPNGGYHNSVPYDSKTDEYSTSECVITEILGGRLMVKLFDKNGAVKDFNITNDSYVTQHLTIALKKPEITYAAVLSNRLCTAHENTVTIAKQGSYNRFYNYEGLAGDSWTSAVPSAGDLSALVTYNQTLLCMKAQFTHELYGNNAKTYSFPYNLSKGCIDHKSICLIGENLFFLASDGIYMYNGVTTKKISSKLKKRYISGVGGTCGRFYYLSAFDGKTHELLVYDTLSGYWYKEDNSQIIAFSSYGNMLYAVFDDSSVMLLNDESASEDFDWYYVTRKFGDTNLSLKKPTEVTILADMEEGSFIKIYIKHDDGEFVLAGETKAINLKPCRIPIKIKPCSTYQIKIEGRGKVCVREISHRLYLNGEQFFNR